MAHFKANIKTKKGVEALEIEAENVKKATMIARRHGKLMTIKKVSNPGGLFEKTLSPAERQVFLQRLSAMLSSKLGASEALQVIKDSFSGTIKMIASRMLKHMEAGADVVQALEKIGAPNFPESILALIKAGSRSGDTWRSLRDAAEFEKEMERVRKGSGKGMWSGIAGFFIAAAVTLGTKFVVAPFLMDSDFFKMTADKTDLSFIDGLSSFLGWTMLGLSIIFITLFLLGSVGRKVIPSQADYIIMKIPFYKDLILARNNYTILYGLSMLISSGVPMEQALSLSASSSPKGQLKTDLEKGVKAIKVGKPWAQAMESLHATDKAALSVSADREQIAHTLSALAYQYRESYAAVVGSFGPSMQLISSIFLVLSGGVLFGYTMLPMLQVAANGM